MHRDNNNQKPLINKEFVYEHLSKEITREESLINNRLTWTLTFNGFLFASVALIGKKQIHPQLEIILHLIIPIVGTAVAGFGILGVIAAYLAIHQQRKEWGHLLNNYPKPGGKSLASWSGRIASLLIPATMLAAWISIFFVLK